MSERATLTTTYTSAEAEPARNYRLTLEPEYAATKTNSADLADIDAMLAMARSGLSALNRLVDRCSWAKWASNGDLTVTLGLYVWPSDESMTYRLVLPAGVASAVPELVQEVKNIKFWVEGDSKIELPWRLVGGKCSWHLSTGCVNAWSEPIPSPPVRVEGAEVYIESDDDAHGVLAVSGTAVGWLHRLSITYKKVAFGENQDEGTPKINGIEAEAIQVAASWTDVDGEEQTEEAELEIPPCVVELLKMCDSGVARTFVKIKDDSDKKEIWAVYYSSCDGSILAQRIVQEEAADE